MYKVQKNDNIVITGDVQNYDDYYTIIAMATNFPQFKYLCITGGAWTHVGTAISVIGNVLIDCNRPDIRIYTGSTKSLYDSQYETNALFDNIIYSDEMMNIDDLYGGRSYIGNEEIKPAGDKTAFYNLVNNLPNVVVLSLGTMTDVVPIASHAKAIIQLGGRFYDPSRPPDYPKINRSASSNLYLDPRAANEVLHIAPSKIYWIFSDSVVNVNTDMTTVNRILQIKTNNKRYNQLLYSLANYFKGMYQKNIILPISDATIAIILKHPELVRSVEQRNIDIVDTLTHTVTNTGPTTVVTVEYDNRIGSMIEGEYNTNLVIDIDNGQLMTQYFYDMITNFQNGDNKPKPKPPIYWPKLPVYCPVKKPCYTPTLPVCPQYGNYIDSRTGQFIKPSVNGNALNKANINLNIVAPVLSNNGIQEQNQIQYQLQHN